MTFTTRTTRTTRSTQRLFAAALLGVLPAAPAWAAPTVAIVGPSSVAPGGSIQLGVTASGFADLYAYQFDIAFDATLFSATGASPGALLGTAGSTFFDGGQVDNTTGLISFIFESLIGPGAGAAGEGELVQLGFVATGPMFSSGSFTITNFVAYDSALNAIDVTLAGASVSIPEPSSLALVLAAIGGGLFGASRRGRAERGATAAA